MVVQFTDVTVISTLLAKAKHGGSVAHYLDGDVGQSRQSGYVKYSCEIRSMYLCSLGYPGSVSGSTFKPLNSSQRSSAVGLVRLVFVTSVMFFSPLVSVMSWQDFIKPYSVLILNSVLRLRSHAQRRMRAHGGSKTS